MTHDQFAGDAALGKVADEMVRLFGAGAMPRLYERAEIAEAIGDRFSAEVWLEIAKAIENP